jgi:hypothetical protein
MSKLKTIVDNKLDKKSFIQQVLKDGYINIDEDDRLKFVVTQINDENFSDINPEFKQQLEDEGKYNSWISFITFSNELAPYKIRTLPIYGNSKCYVTRWFRKTTEEAINDCLNDKQMCLLKRANNYIDNH